jgi:S-disulfanyl-L-cysteine oxidoreductase SoxD
MFKLDRKSIITASLVTAVAFGTAAFSSDSAASHEYADGVSVGKLVIDGGVTYPLQKDKTSSYYMDENTQKGGFSYGRAPTKNELAAWATSVTPHNPPPEGQGTAAKGAELYDAKCGMCHGDFGVGGDGYPALSKGNAYEGKKNLPLAMRKGDDAPARVFGPYWPEASTLWWYIKEGMPHPAPKSLSDDQVYSLVAYILNLNEMKIDGELVDDNYVLDRAKFMKIVMPNKDGFVPKIDGKNGLENARKFFNDPKNIGAINSKNRCMKNCIKGENKLTRITIETKDFLPPLSEVRDLPAAQVVGSPAKSTYDNVCSACHSADNTMGAPGLGNKAAWEKVTSQGMDVVYGHAINGFNGMPAKGGTDLSDKDLKDVVDYMISQSK